MPPGKMEYMVRVMFGIAAFAIFAVCWWLVFRGVRKYPNLHNHADDQNSWG
jgi:hypothetical protein